jgi:hypothetical protein
MIDKVMIDFLKIGSFRKWQAAMAVLFFLFFTGVSWASFHGMLEEGKSLEEVIDYGLSFGMSIESLVTELAVAGYGGEEIICALYRADLEHYGVERNEVIPAALDSWVGFSGVAEWSLKCGASYHEVQTGYSMSNKELPGNMVFFMSDEYWKNTKEYLYNPPSPSQ